MLDEPTSGLDPIGTREMKDLILKLKERGQRRSSCAAISWPTCRTSAIGSPSCIKGELKELGRVDSLLRVRDVTQIRAGGLTDAAKAEIRAVIERYQGHLDSMDNPTTTLEELFLSIVRDSEARPGAAGREMTNE